MFMLTGQKRSPPAITVVGARGLEHGQTSWRDESSLAGHVGWVKSETRDAGLDCDSVVLGVREGMKRGRENSCSTCLSSEKVWHAV